MDKSNKIRLLLVDDHKILRDGLKKAIGQESNMILVGEAENGLQLQISNVIVQKVLRP